jgi:hypothetical protein
MTRQQLVTFLNAHGFPITESTMDKLCAPSVNKGPQVEKYWGRRPLYAPEPGLEWAQSMLRDAPSDIAAA